MNDKKTNVPLEDDLLTGIGGGLGGTAGCGVAEEEFPRLGKCFTEERSISGKDYKAACPYCSIYTSMPEGANLVVAHMFECALYGYVNRVTD